MASSKHTTQYQLNQWQAGDPVLREDFNSDNLKLENALAMYGRSSRDERNVLLKSIVASVDYWKEKGSSPRDFHIDIHLRSFI